VLLPAHLGVLCGSHCMPLRFPEHISSLLGSMCLCSPPVAASQAADTTCVWPIAYGPQTLCLCALQVTEGPDTGKLALLDFGLVAEIPPQDRAAMVSATIHLVSAMELWAQQNDLEGPATKSQQLDGQHTYSVLCVLLRQPCT
jgi:hypothetical protein